MTQLAQLLITRVRKPSSNARSRAVAPGSYLDGREQGPRERSAAAGAGARKRTVQREAALGQCCWCAFKPGVH